MWFSGQGTDQIPTIYDEEDLSWQHWFSDESSSEMTANTRPDRDYGVSLSDLTSELLEEAMHRPYDFVQRRYAFFVTGSAGIGKTLWLHFVLVERLLRNLPTLLQFEHKRIYYFSKDGASIIFPEDNPKDRQLVAEMKQDVWYLFHSNEFNLSPSYAVLASDLPVIQVGLPLCKHFRWHRKITPTCIFWVMKPTTSSEVLQMRSIQDTSLWPDALTITDAMVSSFCSLYGPSARNVFKYAKNPDAYRELLKQRLTRLDRVKRFESLISHAQWFRFGFVQQQDMEGLKMIVGVYPGPSRDDIRVNVLTMEIFQMIVKALGWEWDVRLISTYLSFREESGSVGVAGYMLESSVRRALMCGGQWKGRLMHHSKLNDNTYTDDPAEAPAETLGDQVQPHLTSAPKPDSSGVVWLRVGPGVSVAPTEDPYFMPVPAPSLLDSATADSLSFGNLSFQPTLISPTSHAQYPGFTSLIVDPGKKVITIFQCTRWPKLGPGTIFDKLAVKLCQGQGYSIFYVFATDGAPRTPFVKVPTFPPAIDKYIEKKVHVCIGG
ncbi:hypothetical protein H1R20_g3884, partial [Candolleomyces eurysporus]